MPESDDLSQCARQGGLQPDRHDRFTLRFGYWERRGEWNRQGMTGVAAEAWPNGTRNSTFATEEVHTFSPNLVLDFKAVVTTYIQINLSGAQGFNQTTLEEDGPRAWSTPIAGSITTSRASGSVVSLAGQHGRQHQPGLRAGHESGPYLDQEQAQHPRRRGYAFSAADQQAGQRRYHLQRQRRLDAERLQNYSGSQGSSRATRSPRSCWVHRTRAT